MALLVSKLANQFKIFKTKFKLFSLFPKQTLFSLSSPISELNEPTKQANSNNKRQISCLHLLLPLLRDVVLFSLSWHRKYFNALLYDTIQWDLKCYTIVCCYYYHNLHHNNNNNHRHHQHRYHRQLQHGSLGL